MATLLPRRHGPRRPYRLCLIVVLLLLSILLTNCAAVPSESSKPKTTTSSSLSSIQTSLAKKQLEKELRKSKSKSRYRKSAAKNVDGSNSKQSSSTISSSVSVEAFLIPRTVNLRLVLRTVCFLGLLLSVLRCIQMSGVPFANTIWQILYGGGGDGGTASAIPPPIDYFPSDADIHLAQLMAQMSKTLNVMIPSSSLPSAGPILGVIASVFAYVGLTYLIPQWSTRFRVFLDYVRTDSISAVTSAKSATKKKARKKHRKVPNGESALVCLKGDSATGQRQKATTNSRQSFLICPLYQASSKSKLSSAKSASKPSTNNSTVSLIQDDFDHPKPCYFEVNHCRVYCDPKTKACIDGAPTLQQARFASLQGLVQDGGLSKKQRKVAQERYEPYNTFDLASPKLYEAFVTRISSPLVVIQFVGRLMSLLEEGKGALVSMAESLLQHYNDAKQAIQSAEQMAKEVKTNLQDTSGCMVSVWRSDKNEWILCTAGDLVPGDLFRLNSLAVDDDNPNRNATSNIVIPVDALVVKGQCLTNEAVLTGESVPQVKVPLDFQERKDSEGEDEQRLDVQRDRSSILFAGTTMLGAGSSSLGGKKDEGMTCLALRTGTYSSKGQLLKALKGSGHVGAISNPQSDKDAMLLIASLSLCAAMSCASLFVRRDGKVAKVSPFRRVVQCTRIILASIPSSLPLALASVAKTCSRMLRYLSDVVCSEPGSLLTSAYVDTVVFDKTGTLTADTQSLSKLVLPSGQSGITDGFQRFLLAGCHSLVAFQDGSNGKRSLIGDPLDQAAFLFSGWKYNEMNDAFALSQGNGTSVNDVEPVRLWQISNFPFDPSRRLSSSIVLVELKNSSLELWRLTKGSPEAMEKLFEADAKGDDAVFEAQTKQLEADGFRSISMGAENLTGDSICHQLFPEGLSISPESLMLARSESENLHRNDIESRMLTNYGFSCFNAAIRPSSRRVINELRGSDIDCVMLTGDSVDAALSVATKIDLVTTRKVMVLELSEASSSGDMKLVWRKMKFKADKGGSLRKVEGTSQSEVVTVASVRKLLGRQVKGSYSIAASGAALEYVLGNDATDAHRMILRKLGSFSVIARATPEMKKQVIDSLQVQCGKRVMMCGDGVNDVAAIQTADVAAALLNGFGAEADVTSGKDLDNERRTRKAKAMDIGSNREGNAAKAHKRANRNEANKRIQDQIKEAKRDIKTRVEEEQDGQYTIADVKELFAVTFKAVRDEKDRAKKLQKGGGDAARILAEERRNQGQETEDNGLEEEVEEEIKPGEVSLVSSFSCLHPSIDGVDAILREGVATAASALATQQSIALHCLLSCFHLATLYRDGFRYSQKMYVCETIAYMAIDSFRYRASCQPRPRLPSSAGCRPPMTMFEPASIFTTVGQAVTHLLFMSWAVGYAKHLGNQGAVTSSGKIGLNSLTPFGDRLGKVVDTLSRHPMQGASNVDDEEDNKSYSFFRRPVFKPNYETNMVFLFSILQMAISSLVNHQGKPFYHGILESREFCKACCLAVAFFMACVSGLMPRLTTFLDVKPFPSGKSKLVVVALAAGNALFCILCQWVASRFLSKNTNDISEDTREDDGDKEGPVAADLEERLLREESEMNARGIRMFCGFLVYCMVQIIAEAMISPPSSEEAIK